MKMLLLNLFQVKAKTLLQNYQQTINMIQRLVQLRDHQKEYVKQKDSTNQEESKAGSSS